MQRVAHPFQPHVDGVRQESEAELNVRIAQCVALGCISLEQQHRTGNGWQECFRLVTGEHRQRSGVDRGQHVWIELVQAERLVGESFQSFAKRKTDAELVAIGSGAPEPVPA